MKKINEANKQEFISEVIDIFENFLILKKIEIPNDEKDEDPNVEKEEITNIYGSDYGYIQTELETLLESWGVTND